MTAPLENETVGYSPKFIWGTLTATALGMFLAVVTWVTENVDLLGFGPIWSGILLAVSFPLTVGIATFQARPGVVQNASGRHTLNEEGPNRI